MAMVNQINWTKLINDILASDRKITPDFIAKKVGVHRSTVSRWRSFGIEPTHSRGELLINLWREKTLLNTPPKMRSNKNG